MDPWNLTYLIPDRKPVRVNDTNEQKPVYATRTVGYVPIRFVNGTDDSASSSSGSDDSEVRPSPLFSSLSSCIVRLCRVKKPM